MEINIKWNICRVCLVEEQNKDQMSSVGLMRHIFNEDKLLVEQIYECSGILMKPNDNLPEKVCKKCLTMIKYAVKFRKTCRESDTYLQSVLKRTKSASILFKQGQPSDDLLEECTSNNCKSYDTIESEIDDRDTTNVTEQSKTLKPLGKHAENNLKKSRKQLNSLETNSNTDHEYEENIDEKDLSHIVEEQKILDNSKSCVNHISTPSKRIAIVGKNLTDDVSSKTPYVQGIQISEVVIDEYDEEFAENQETQSNNLNENNEMYYLNNEKENISQEEVNQQNVHDDREEDNGQVDEMEFVTVEEQEGQQELFEDYITSDIDDNQAKVSSTVNTNEEENNIIEQIIDEISSVSTDQNDEQAEYIIEELSVDDSNSDLFPQKSRVEVKSKKSKTPRNYTSIKVGSKAEVWVCDLCANHFTNRQLLNAHMKVHLQEKKHECELCFKRFITACNLQAHMRIHTGEKPYKCKYCGRRFSDRSSNLRHERTHTNEKPFQCKECGKAFSLATTLKKHLKVHTGERSYRCDLCAKAFRLAHQLKAHKNTTLHKAVEHLVRLEQ